MKNILFLLVLITGFFANSAVKTQLADTVVIGTSSASTDKTLFFNKGSGSTNPSIKLDAATSKIQYSQDGANFLTLGTSTPIASKTISSDYTVTSSDDLILAEVQLNVLLVSLPTAVGRSGKVFTFKIKSLLVSGISYSLVIDAFGSETVEGATEFEMFNKNDSVTIVSDGANWFVYSSSIKKESFIAWTTSTYSQPANTWITVPLSNTSDSAKYPVTGNTVTIKKTARYRITCKNTFTPNNGETGYVTYSINGASESSNWLGAYGLDSNPSGSVGHIEETKEILLNKGDVLRLRTQLATNARNGTNGFLEIVEL